MALWCLPALVFHNRRVFLGKSRCAHCCWCSWKRHRSDVAVSWTSGKCAVVSPRSLHRSRPIWQNNVMGIMLAFLEQGCVLAELKILCVRWWCLTENTQQKSQSASADITQCPLWRTPPFPPAQTPAAATPTSPLLLQVPRGLSGVIQWFCQMNGAVRSSVCGRVVSH